MVIDISDNLLESIKRELLNSLRSVETQVIDLLEFGDTQDSEKISEQLHIAESTLTMLSEVDAAILCGDINQAIQSVIDDSDLDQDKLTAAFLVLLRYIEELSATEESSIHLGQVRATLQGQAFEGYSLTDESKAILQKAAVALGKFESIANAELFWKNSYKVTKVIRNQVKTQESYEFIWLLQQLAILNIKGEKETPLEVGKTYTNVLLGYVDDLISLGETPSNYHKIIDNIKELNTQISAAAGVIRSDYTPPNQRLTVDTSGKDVMFPVSPETIEAIAFSIKKELAVTKNLFEENLSVDKLNNKEIKKQLKVSFELPYAAFRLLGFRPGVSLIEQSNALLKEGFTDENYAKFANNVVLIEDALWQLDFLDQKELIDDVEKNVAQQSQHTRKIAVQASRVVSANNAYIFFKKLRDKVIENFERLESLDMMRISEELHKLRATAELLQENELAAILQKSEQEHLFLTQQQEKINQPDFNKAYLDLVVTYEIIFEQLQNSVHIDKRALKILDSAQKQLAAQTNFNIEQMASPDYVNYDTAGIKQVSQNSQPDDSVDAIDFDLELEEVADNSMSEAEAPVQAEEPAQTEDLGGSADGVSDIPATVTNEQARSEKIFEQITAKENLTLNEAVESISQDEFDEEILEIFIEEGQGIADLLEEKTPLLADNYFNEDVIAELRRAYHTLKGSGRMVGINVFGEFAWQHEELLNRVIAGECQLNEIALRQFTDAHQLVRKMVDSEPFTEDRDALLIAAARAEAIKNLLMGKIPLPEVSIDTVSTSLDSGDLSDEALDGLAERLTDKVSSEKERADDNAINLSAIEKSTDDVADARHADANISLSGSSESGKLEGSDATVLALGSSEKLVSGIASHAALSKLGDYAELANDEVAPVVLDTTTAMSDAQQEAVGTASVDNQTTITDRITIDEDTATGTTADISLTASTAASDNVGKTTAGEITIGAPTIEQTVVAESLGTGESQSTDTIADISLAASTTTSDNVGKTTAGEITTSAPTIEQTVVAESLGTDESQSTDATADISLTASTATSDNVGGSTVGEITTSVPTVEQTIVTESLGTGGSQSTETTADVSASTSDNVGKTAAAEATTSAPIIEQAEIPEISSGHIAVPASSYVGVAQELSKQAEKLRQQFAPIHLDAGDFQHDEIIDSIYDLEASLDTKDVPAWVWETLANLETTVSGMQKKSLSPSPDDYQKICDALDAIEHSDEIGEESINTINNALMGIRADLPQRENYAKQAQTFAESITEDVKNANFVLNKLPKTNKTHAELAKLSRHIDNINHKATVANQHDAEELSSQLKSLLNKMQALPENKLADSVSQSIKDVMDGIVGSHKQQHGSVEDYQPLLDKLNQKAFANTLSQQIPIKPSSAEQVTKSEATAPQAENKANFKQFADEAEPHIEASKEHFTQWKGGGFEPQTDLENLHNRMDDITSASKKHQFYGAASLSENVADVLRRLHEEKVKPHEATSEHISQAINEFDRSVGSVRLGSGNPEISPQLIQASQSLVDTPNLETELPLDSEAANALSAKETGASVTHPYQEFVNSADKYIKSSKTHFGDWKGSNFIESTLRNHLSHDMEDLTKLSEQYEFTSATKLGQATGGLLDRLAKENIYPNEETTDQIEKAVNEFERSASDIKSGGVNQEMRHEVVQNINKTAEADITELGKPLDLVLASLGKPEREDFFSSQDDATTIDSLRTEDVGKVSARAKITEQLGAFQDEEDYAGQTELSHDEYGLRSNDSQALDSTILGIFLDEAEDIIRKNKDSLDAWKLNYDNLSAVQEMQRGLHTLKGGSRMAGLMVLGDLAHYIETLLESVVNGSIKDKDKACSMLQSGCDLTTNMVQLAANGKVVYESPTYIEELSNFIQEQTGKSLGYKRILSDKKLDIPVASTAPTRADIQKKKSYTLRVKSELMDKISNLIGENSITRTRLERSTTEHSFQINELSRTITRVREQLRRLENETETQILFQHDSTSDANESFDPLELDRFSEIQQLSRLLAESMDDLHSIRGTLSNFINESRQILTTQSNIHRELQDSIFVSSLVRFDSLQERMEAIVERAAKELYKEIKLEIYGGEIEIERNILEKIIPGLEHTIRNSVSHGIETPNERKRKGKSTTGQIRLTARRRGAEIWFSVSDDGRGANLAAIRKKAERLGMLDEKQAHDKSYLLRLLFEPGFTTADKATQLFGRGIGLDVLKDVVNEHHGSIEIETEADEGMTTSIRLPFTVSAANVLPVKIGQFIYAVPIMSIEGIARIPHDLYKLYREGKMTHYSYGQYTYKMESLIDFIDPYAERTLSEYGVPALLIKIGHKHIAFEVEEIGKRQEIIIKSVNRQFTSLPGIIGATILDNDKPVPVLEAATLGRYFLRHQEKGEDIRNYIAPEQITEESKTRVLVVDDSITIRKISSKILNKYDVEVEIAKDGLDAIDVISEWMPDLILLDIEMPRMDGFEFATHVRNSKEFAQVPIIMITSRTGSKHRERADAIGVNDYLGKPYTEEILIQTIEKILDKKLEK